MYKTNTETYYDFYFFSEMENKLYFLYRFDNITDVFILLAKSRKNTLSIFNNRLEKTIISRLDKISKYPIVYEYIWKYQFNFAPHNTMIVNNLGNQFYLSTYISEINKFYNKLLSGEVLKYINENEYVFKSPNYRGNGSRKYIHYKSFSKLKLSNKEIKISRDPEYKIYFRAKRNLKQIKSDYAYGEYRNYYKSWKHSYKVKKQWMKNKKN